MRRFRWYILVVSRGVFEFKYIEAADTWECFNECINEHQVPLLRWLVEEKITPKYKGLLKMEIENKLTRIIQTLNNL